MTLETSFNPFVVDCLKQCFEVDSEEGDFIISATMPCRKLLWSKLFRPRNIPDTYRDRSWLECHAFVLVSLNYLLLRKVEYRHSINRYSGVLQSTGVFNLDFLSPKLSLTY